MAKKQEKPKKRKNLILRLILPVIAFCAVMELVSMQIELGQKKRELELVQTQVVQQQLENKELERQLSTELEEDYIERYARDHLDYVAPGDKVFIDISGS